MMRGHPGVDEDRIRGAVRLGIEGGRLNESAMTEPIETLLQKSELLNDGKLSNAAVMLFTMKVGALVSTVLWNRVLALE